MLKETTPPIVAKRLLRNLQYRLTYSYVLEMFADPDPDPEVVGLLKSLIEDQQAAARLVSAYLDKLDVDTQELGMKQRLLEHASACTKVNPRLKFIHSGLSKAASWYRVQLMDRQMTADPELRQMLMELGEMEAAGLWRTEALMAVRGMLPEGAPEERRELPAPGRDRRPGWRARLAADIPRPPRKGGRSRKRQSPTGSG